VAPMADHNTRTVDGSGNGGTVLDSEADLDRGPRELRASRCHQCHFPWSLHGKRYDREERAFARVCSEYPARPVRSIQDCIVP